jgi:hypothetical protein
MRRWTFSAALLSAALVLSACNSTDAVLDPSAAPQPSTAAADPSAALPAEGDSVLPSTTAAQPGAVLSASSTLPQPGTNAQTAVLSQQVRLQLAPIVGATVEAVTPLTRRLSQRAAQRGIGLTVSGDPAATHLMKGYFSAVTDGNETTVIYVWDVLDPAGNRLHRIQGQEVLTGATAEGWQGVPAQTMEAVGDKTIDQLAAWLAPQSG